MGTVTKVIEVSSSSKKSMEDAVQSGLKKVAKSVKNIKGAWVNEIKVVTGDDGSITEWRVNMRVSFVVD
ncbi:dodecin family protein [Arenimonas caeni]|jgi:flavin-binding protein dodecin|uniref:dodecin family protein n=1 Tax=Arenimonas caeni TaxID=2058085 RepID=UPI002A365ACC|nr:dodecin family protein [Arenimonas caeni]MDY0023014.1 dodecin family protein [Arenimonas caeni]